MFLCVCVCVESFSLFKRGKWVGFFILSYAVLTRLWSISNMLWKVEFVLEVSLTEISGMKNQSLLKKIPSDASWYHSVKWGSLTE